MKCQKCGSFKVRVERRPNGNGYCDTCGFQTRTNGVDWTKELDTCKWEQLNENYKSDCMPDLILSVKFADYFRYCPYCGKTVSIRG